MKIVFRVFEENLFLVIFQHRTQAVEVVGVRKKSHSKFIVLEQKKVPGRWLNPGTKKDEDL